MSDRASETLLHDVLFPAFDQIATEYDVNSDEIMHDLSIVLLPDVLAEYAVWISESWEAVEPAVPLAAHGPVVEPPIYRPGASDE